MQRRMKSWPRTNASVGAAGSAPLPADAGASRPASPTASARARVTRVLHGRAVPAPERAIAGRPPGFAVASESPIAPQPTPPCGISYRVGRRRARRAGESRRRDAHLDRAAGLVVCGPERRIDVVEREAVGDHLAAHGLAVASQDVERDVEIGPGAAPAVAERSDDPGLLHHHEE